MKTIQLSDAAYAELRAAFDLPREPFNSVGFKTTEGDIVYTICGQCHVTIQDILSNSRRSYVVWARFTIWALMHEVMGVNYCEIGRRFKKDHGTVMYGIKSHRNRLETDSQYADWFRRVRNSLNPAPTASPDAITATLIAKEVQDSGRA